MRFFLINKLLLRHQILFCDVTLSSSFILQRSLWKEVMMCTTHRSRRELLSMLRTENRRELSESLLTEDLPITPNYSFTLSFSVWCCVYLSYPLGHNPAQTAGKSSQLRDLGPPTGSCVPTSINVKFWLLLVLGFFFSALHSIFSPEDALSSSCILSGIIHKSHKTGFHLYYINKS